MLKCSSARLWTQMIPKGVVSQHHACKLSPTGCVGGSMNWKIMQRTLGYREGAVAFPCCSDWAHLLEPPSEPSMGDTSFTPSKDVSGWRFWGAQGHFNHPFVKGSSFSSTDPVFPSTQPWYTCLTLPDSADLSHDHLLMQPYGFLFAVVSLYPLPLALCTLPYTTTILFHLARGLHYYWWDGGGEFCKLYNVLLCVTKDCRVQCPLNLTRSSSVSLSCILASLWGKRVPAGVIRAHTGQHCWTLTALLTSYYLLSPPSPLSMWLSSSMVSGYIRWGARYQLCQGFCQLPLICFCLMSLIRVLKLQIKPSYKTFDWLLCDCWEGFLVNKCQFMKGTISKYGPNKTKFTSNLTQLFIQQLELLKFANCL